MDESDAAPASNALKRRKEEARRKYIKKEIFRGMISSAVSRLLSEAKENNGGRLPHLSSFRKKSKIINV
jgi:hypothetical protein